MASNCVPAVQVSLGLHGAGRSGSTRTSARRTRSASTSVSPIPTTTSRARLTTPARSIPAASALAISPESMTTLPSRARAISGSSTSPSDTAGTTRSGSREPHDLVFDHVRFLTSTYGMGMGNIERTYLQPLRVQWRNAAVVFPQRSQGRVHGSSATKGPFTNTSASRPSGT